VEIGWRLARHHWGKGYATEAALASLDFGFDVVGRDRIVSFAVEGNSRSRRVMERIGMVHSPDFDFDHPRVEPDSPLLRHAFYAIENNQRQSSLPPA
jgi:RimJ/RimL family protein N-acetyltransferase